MEGNYKWDMEPIKNGILQIPHPSQRAAILCRLFRRVEGVVGEGKKDDSYYLFHACCLCKPLNSHSASLR